MGRESSRDRQNISDIHRIAIVMTLLVLGVEVPQVPDEMIADQLFREVVLLWRLIAAYVVSFLVLGIYWMGHHTQFHFMRGVDSIALWMNILFFMFISLIRSPQKW